MCFDDRKGPNLVEHPQHQYKRAIGPKQLMNSEGLDWYARKILSRFKSS